MSSQRGRFRPNSRGRGRWRGGPERGPGPVPKKWLDYRKLGDRMVGTRFIVFKTPVKNDINRANDVPSHQRFTPDDLLSMIAEQKEELGLVIDMTNTKRYYNHRDITSKGPKYHKYMLEGHGEVPSEEDYQSFQKMVDEFLSKNADNDKLIGVHGTTSTNRPGYLICRYLIEKKNWKPTQAIQDFKIARGHPIEEQRYIDALMSLGPPSLEGSDREDEDFLQDVGKASVSTYVDDAEERRPNGFTADDYIY